MLLIFRPHVIIHRSFYIQPASNLEGFRYFCLRFHGVHDRRIWLMFEVQVFTMCVLWTSDVIKYEGSKAFRCFLPGVLSCRSFSSHFRRTTSQEISKSTENRKTCCYSKMNRYVTRFIERGKPS